MVNLGRVDTTPQRLSERNKLSQYNEAVAERPADDMKYWNDALHLSTNLGRLMLRSFLGTSDAGIPSNLLRELTPATVEAILRERRAEMARWVAENPAYPAAFDHAKAEWRARP